MARAGTESDSYNSVMLLTFPHHQSQVPTALCIGLTVLSSLSLPAPSAVSIMHQVSRTVDSITLSWSQPDQPNGVILDYELQYYEKVSAEYGASHC